MLVNAELITPRLTFLCCHGNLADGTDEARCPAHTYLVENDHFRLIFVSAVRHTLLLFN